MNYLKLAGLVLVAGILTAASVGMGILIRKEWEKVQ